MKINKLPLIIWIVWLNPLTVFATVTDSYEEDNTFQQANVIHLNIGIPQQHNLHQAGDEDWVKFYALAGQIYAIKVSQVGSDIDPVIEVYAADGTTLLVSKDGKLAGEEEILSGQAPENGVYYVKIRHYDSATLGEQTAYTLQIDRFVAPHPNTLSGLITDSISGQPLTNALLKTDDNASTLSLLEGVQLANGQNIQTSSYLMSHRVGTFMLTVGACGYQTLTETIVIEAENTTKDIVLTPLAIETLVSSQELYSSGERLLVSVPSRLEHCEQYLGIGFPDGHISIVTGLNQFVPFEGQIPQWQGLDIAVDSPINTDFPPGNYLLYLLQMQTYIEPMSIPMEQWKLGVSVFSVR